MLSHTEDIKKITKKDIVSACIPENLLGAGGQCNVYSMPSHPEYIIRIPKQVLPSNIANLIFNVHENVAPGKNFGQPLAYYSTQEDNSHSKIDICLRQPGDFNLYFQPLKYVEESKVETVRQHNHDRLFAISKAPLQSYEEHVRNINYLSNIGLYIDAEKGANLHFDEKQQTFHVTDLDTDTLNGNNSPIDIMVQMIGQTLMRIKHPRGDGIEGYFLKEDECLLKTVLHKLLEASKNVGGFHTLEPGVPLPPQPSVLTFTSGIYAPEEIAKIPLDTAIPTHIVKQYVKAR